ncbi:hypothetical protein OIU78_019947 [Salix suchowensis]|nr:hypothetical protein OIU78_019947 [Salix suchowensis]
MPTLSLGYPFTKTTIFTAVDVFFVLVGPARIAEVKAWLTSQFDAAEIEVPDFQYTPRSIAHFFNSATVSQAKTQADSIVANDFRQKVLQGWGDARECGASSGEFAIKCGFLSPSSCIYSKLVEYKRH